MALVLEPLANAELILGGTQQSRLLLGVLTTLDLKVSHWHSIYVRAVVTYVVQNQKNFALKFGRCS